MNNFEVIRKIKRPYVQDDSIQIMLPHKDTITLLNKDGIQLHIYENITLINTYLNDTRRWNFPYGKIPSHYELIRLKKYKYTNQIITLEEPFLQIQNGIIIEMLAAKSHNKDVLLYNKILNPVSKSVQILTLDELNELINKKGSLYTATLDGEILKKDKNNQMVKEERLLEEYQSDLRRALNSRYLVFDSWDLKAIGKGIDNITIEDVPRNTNYVPIILISSESETLEVNILNIKFLSPNNYQATLKVIPITLNILEYLKSNIRTRYIKYNNEPKIPYLLNREIPLEIVRESKKLVKSLT